MCTQTVQTTLWKSLVVEKEEMAGVGGGVEGCTQTALVIASIEKPEAGVGRPEYDGTGLGLGVKSCS